MSRLFTAHAQGDDGKRFIVRADEKRTAFREVERITRESLRPKCRIVRHNPRRAAF